MEVTIVGCSGSFAGPDSPASCYLLRAEPEGRTWSIVLDLGNGALGNLQRHIDPLSVDAVLISHLHVDHFIDLCGLYVMLKYVPGGSGRARSLPTAPRAPASTWPAPTATSTPRTCSGVFEFRDLRDREPSPSGPSRSRPWACEHTIESYGFRVEADGRMLAYTGDTDSVRRADTELMTGADLVLADAAFVDGRDTVTGHPPVGSRARRARPCGPGECSASCSRTCPRGTTPTSAARRPPQCGRVRSRSPSRVPPTSSDLPRAPRNAAVCRPAGSGGHPSGEGRPTRGVWAERCAATVADASTQEAPCSSEPSERDRSARSVSAACRCRSRDGPTRTARSRTIHAALDVGVTLIDTADAYHRDASDVGHNETLIAQALDAWSGDPGDVLVATKGGHLRPGDGSWTLDGRPEHLKQAARGVAPAARRSRRSVSTSSTAPTPRSPYAESVGAIRDLLDDGIIQMAGISNAEPGPDPRRPSESSAAASCRCRTSSRRPSAAASRSSTSAPSWVSPSCPWSPLGGIAQGRPTSAAPTPPSLRSRATAA